MTWQVMAPPQSGAMPPLPELIVWGERVRAAAQGRTGLGLDEAALALVSRFVGLSRGKAVNRLQPTARQ